MLNSFTGGTKICKILKLWSNLDEKYLEKPCSKNTLKKMLELAKKNVKMWH